MQIKEWRSKVRSVGSLQLWDLNSSEIKAEMFYTVVKIFYSPERGGKFSFCHV